MFLQLIFGLFIITPSELLKITDTTLMIKELLNAYPNRQDFRVVHISCSMLDSISIFKSLSASDYYINTLLPPIKYIPHHLQHNILIYIVDLSCNSSLEIINMANENNFYAAPYRWIFITDNNFQEDTFKNINILIDSDVIMAKANQNNTFDVFKIYKRRVNLELIYEYYARWYERNLLLIEKFDSINAVRRKNLEGTVLNTCLVITHNSSYQHLMDKREKHLDSISKVSIVFMHHLGEMFNATMNYSFESSWGYKGNDSKWTGLMAKLVHDNVDVSGTPLFVTSDRVPIIDYIAMTTATKSKFVFRQPKLSYITNVFTLPFNTSVWISSLFLVIITALTLYIVVKWEWYKKRVYNYNDDDAHLTETELRDSFLDVIFTAYGAVCQQGASAVPYNTTGRVITILLFISLMFLYTSYSANIVALLQSSSTSIQTLNDLLRSRLQVGVDDTVFNHFFFPNASEPIHRALYLQKVAPAGQKEKYFLLEEGVKKIREGLFAFHMETGAGYKIVGETFMEDEKCGLQEIQFLEVPDPWIACQKNSSFKEILKIGFTKILETGIQPREVSLIYTPKPQCISRGSSFIGVSIIDCYAAAVILVGGVAASAVIFLLEVIYSKMHKLKFLVSKMLSRN